MVATPCPNCETSLICDGSEPATLVRCVTCRALFDLTDKTLIGPLRTSRKAVASLALGLCSMVCMLLTGLPAIVLGVWALRDIRRRANELKGRGTAVAGIATGSVFGVICTGCIALQVVVMMLTWPKNIRPLEDPTEIRQLADTMLELDLPAGLKPTEGMELILGMRQVEFADSDKRKEAGTTILLMQFPAVPMHEKQALPQAEGNAMRVLRQVDKSERILYDIGQKPSPVTRFVGTNRFTGRRCRCYVTAVKNRHNAFVAVMVATDEADGQGDRLTLSEEQVRRLFESIKP